MSGEDPLLEDFVEGVVAVVEASSFEYAKLYEDNQSRGGDWEENLCGMGRTVGELAGRPVFVSLRTAVVGGRKVLFVNPTSQVVDWLMVRGWLLEKLPACTRHSDGRLKLTDADNFHRIAD